MSSKWTPIQPDNRQLKLLLLQKKFKLLAEDTLKQQVSNSAATASVTDIQSELDRFEAEMHSMPSGSALDFWLSRLVVYPKLGLLAQDLVAAPVSQAYVERVFSLCGDMCARKRNRMSISLERRVFLKMNYALMNWQTQTIDTPQVSKRHKRLTV